MAYPFDLSLTMSFNRPDKGSKLSCIALKRYTDTYRWSLSRASCC